MKKLLVIVAVFALVLGVMSTKAEAFNVNINGPVKWKFSDFSTGTLHGASAGYGQSVETGDEEADEDAWGVFKVDSLRTDDFASDALWVDTGVAGTEMITGIYYGIDDDKWDIGATSQHTEAVGGHIAFYLDVYSGAPGTPFDASAGPNGRTSFDKYGDITDGELLLLLDLVPGIKYGNSDATDDHITYDSNLDFDTQVLGGDGTFFANVAGGSLGYLFDTGIWALNNDSGGPTEYVDFFGIFDVDVIGSGVGDEWLVRSEDPVRGAANAVPEPTTVVLLGIGLVGMAGVAVRKKFGKDTVKKS